MPGRARARSPFPCPAHAPGTLFFAEEPARWAVFIWQQPPFALWWLPLLISCRAIQWNPERQTGISSSDKSCLGE